MDLFLLLMATKKNGILARSLASVEGNESDIDSIESIECDDDALPFDIDDYLAELHDSEDVSYSGSDA